MLRRVGASPAAAPKLSNQEKASEVAFLVFDTGFQNLSRILPCRLPPGYARGIFQLVRDDMLHASGGVIERNWLDVGMLVEEVPALVEGNGMGQDAPEGAHLHAGRRDHVVDYAKQVFGLNKDASRDQQVRMLRDGSRQSVLNGDDR